MATNSIYSGYAMTASCALLRSIVQSHHETQVTQQQERLCQKTFSDQDIASASLHC